ncbi:MAG: NPCBM/NEW2 domain-containing protein [Clostridiales bacterium]|nr:NPCBM/NEW2 domain-containing protein [Clostridiales bacterium]
MKCSSCGSELNPKEKFCGSCGAKVILHDTPIKVGKPKKSKKVIALIVAIAIILACIPTGWFVLNHISHGNNLELATDLNEIFIDTGKQTITFYAKTSHNGAYLVLVDDSTQKEVARLYDDGKTNENGDQVAKDGVFSGQISNSYNKETTLKYLAKIPSGKCSNVVSISVSTNYSEDQLTKMQAVDDTLSSTLSDKSFSALTEAEKVSLIQGKLNELAAKGTTESPVPLINADSISYDEIAKLFTFEYICGSLGGVSIMPSDPNIASNGEKQSNSFNTSLNPTITNLAAQSGSENKPAAAIMYGWDEWGQTSDWQNYYTYYKDEWTNAGLDTTLYTAPTVATYQTELKNKNIIIFATHGSRFSIHSGFLWLNKDTYSVICTLEDVTKANKKTYKTDLNQHRIASVTVVGGQTEYWILPSFFEYYYSNGGLNNSIIYMDNCLGFGDGQVVDYNLSWALSNAGGASTVIGYHESVYIAYGISVMETLIDDLIGGQTTSEALTVAKDKWGNTDLEYAKNNTKWDTSGHTVAYPVLAGKSDMKLDVSSSSNSDFSSPTDKIELTQYSGKDINDVATQIGNMKSDGATDGSHEMTNGSVIIATDPGGSNVSFISIESDCNYTLCGIAYGDKLQEAVQMLNDKGWAKVEQGGIMIRLENSIGDSISLYSNSGVTISGISYFPSSLSVNSFSNSPSSNEQNGIVYMDTLTPTNKDRYTGNEGDSFIETIVQSERSGAGWNKDAQGNTYDHGLSAWIARWDGTAETSWVWAEYNLGKNYTSLTGKLVLLRSNNSTDFNTNFQVIGDGKVLYNIDLTPTNLPTADLNIDVTGVSTLRLSFHDNRSVCAGTTIGMANFGLTS